MKEKVVLLLGSNMGRRVRRLREAIRSLSSVVEVREASRLYASEPWGRTGQPWFLNAAVRGATSLSPGELLAFAKNMEKEAGRKSGARWGPRELDVDILLMGTRMVREPELTIPHPAIAARRFVLLPAAEVAPEWVVPPAGNTVRDLLDACGDPSEVYPL